MIKSANKWDVPLLKVSYTRKPNEVIQIDSVWKAKEVLRQMWDSQLLHVQEQFCALYLDNQNNVLGFRVISTGTLNSCAVDIQLLMSIALTTRASNIIIAHNHPSGAPLPSEQDKAITIRIQNAGKLLGINVTDHIILYADHYFSFALANIM